MFVTIDEKDWLSNISITAACLYYVPSFGRTFHERKTDGLIERIDTLKYLGTYSNNDLKWSSNTDHIVVKNKQ